MSKVRVYELAKELGMDSKTVLVKLQDMGEFVRSASSTVEAPVARRLKEALPPVPPGEEKPAKKVAKKAAKKAAAPAPATEPVTDPVAAVADRCWVKQPIWWHRHGQTSAAPRKQPIWFTQHRTPGSATPRWSCRSTPTQPGHYAFSAPTTEASRSGWSWRP